MRTCIRCTSDSGVLSATLPRCPRHAHLAMHHQDDVEGPTTQLARCGNASAVAFGIRHWFWSSPYLPLLTDVVGEFPTLWSLEKRNIARNETSRWSVR